jgi:uncharacterized protein
VVVVVLVVLEVCGSMIYKGVNLGILVTNYCNLNCSYCYESHSIKDIDVDNAKIFIDYIFNDFNLLNSLKRSSDNVILNFHGGEVLAKYQILGELMLYFLSKIYTNNNNYISGFRFNLSTNGTLLENQNIRNFLLKWKNLLSIGISIDGTPELHDLNRKYLNGDGSWKDIEKSFYWLRDTFNITTTKSTLNKKSIPYIFDSLVYLHEKLGFTEINQNFIQEQMDIDKHDLYLIDEQLSLCTEYCLKHKDLKYSMLFDINKKPATCGMDSGFVLGTDNKIYSCVRALDISQDGDNSLHIGEIIDGKVIISPSKTNAIKAIQLSDMFDSECLMCKVLGNCQACAANSYKLKNNFKHHKFNCEIMKIQYKWSEYYDRKRLEST